MDAKLIKLTQHMAKDEWEKAFKMAAKFYDLGEQKDAIMQAHQAITNERFYRQIGKDPEKAIEAGIGALKERYPDYLDYEDMVQQKTSKRQETIKKKAITRKKTLADGDETAIAELEHGVYSWERILVRSGFVFKKKGEGYDFSPETESNFQFLLKILEEVGESTSLKDKIFKPSCPTTNQSEWLGAVSKIHSGAEVGEHDNLSIMDTYIAGIVRWINETGIPTDISCDGHGRRNPSVCLRNKKDATVFDSCLVLISEGAWRYEGTFLKYPTQPGRGISKKRNLFHRGWLLDAAEKLYDNQQVFKKLVPLMRQIK